MKTNEELQYDVQLALGYEPLLHAAEIGVSVSDGIVTLSGIVDSLAKKTEAEHAAKSVAGVRAVVDEVSVHIGKRDFADDIDIARDAVRMLQGSLIIPQDALTVTVEDGWLTLEGTLHWNYQREHACHLVKDLPGVRGVTNEIRLGKELAEKVDSDQVVRAMRRHWSIDADEIEVEVHGTAVELKGTVCSLYQKEEAEKLAYKTPGVTKVINNLVVNLEQPYLC
ncbi:ornithine aminotransferase [Flavobacterium album]|uniref:Ornithine aminotransferase n=1 Tax=Flavobacterium album TaxID=2175091 RepID=A0A2S1R169_9FLAO|nr:BON domain-containing protein [Flavobacterium album]AWH86384.1 ornithine aminotransferase [Flavobacterium album]